MGLPQMHMATNFIYQGQICSIGLRYVWQEQGTQLWRNSWNNSSRSICWAHVLGIPCSHLSYFIAILMPVFYRDAQRNYLQMGESFLTDVLKHIISLLHYWFSKNKLFKQDMLFKTLFQAFTIKGIIREFIKYNIRTVLWWFRRWWKLGIAF